VAHLLERTICIGLSYLLTLYWQFMIRKFLLGFLPLEGFPGDKCCVSCECVFLSDLVLMLLLSIEMQRTIIMASAWL
jgi:hypothetical protein